MIRSAWHPLGDRFVSVLFYFIFFCSSRKMLQFKRRGISKNWIFQESFRVLSTKYEFTSFFKQFFFLNFSFISIYTKQLIKMMRTVRCVAGKCRHPLRLGNILDSLKCWTTLADGIPVRFLSSLNNSVNKQFRIIFRCNLQISAGF